MESRGIILKDIKLNLLIRKSDLLIYELGTIDLLNDSSPFGNSFGDYLYRYYADCIF
jgi:hypothetical protein